MSLTAVGTAPAANRGGKDIAFAVGIVLILCLFFLPVPAVMIDFGLALSIALSVLILMVALWIHKPLEFSAFPTVLWWRRFGLALNISTTRLILSHGEQGPTSAGYIIGGFAHLVMGGDFVIGIIVFLILVTINFLVITKGATRIAEVGARFTLDAIPGKQMAIDADLSAGLIDEKVAQARRRELEEESAFFGSMDGASKFVRGDAIAGLIILAVNIFGGIVIGVTRHSLTLSAAADVFTKLSVGDGLVTQIPALIISLAAGLLVAKGGTRGSADKAVIDQLSGYPNALFLAALTMAVLGVVPGLPFLPFALIGGLMASVRIAIPRRIEKDRVAEVAKTAAKDERAKAEARASIKEQLKSFEIELVLSKELNAALLPSRDEIGSRIAKMRRKFARQYGFVVPEIRLSDDLRAAPRTYQIKIHGAAVATHELRVTDHLIVIGDGPHPHLPGDEVREPAFGIRAIAIPEAFVKDARRAGFKPVDPVSVLLTHLSEVIHNNLAQLLSYKDMRALLDRLEPEYKRLLDDMCPSQISQSGLLATLKLLLAERVSIRNLSLILEAVAEVAPHVRRPEQIVEQVRIRLSQQICGDLADEGALAVLRLGNRWDLTFHQSLKRDAKGEVIEFDIDPRLMEQFAAEASAAIRKRMDERRLFALVTAAETRPYVRMIIERMFPTLAVLSQLEIARGLEVKSLGTSRDRAHFRGDDGAARGARAQSGDRRLRAVLPHRRLPDAGARVLERADSNAGSPVRGSRGHPDPDATAPRARARRRAGRRSDPHSQNDCRESLVGGMIGVLARIFYFALEALAVGAATMLGFTSPSGFQIENDEPMAPLATLISLAAIALLFAANLHWELLRGLVASYDVVPVGADFNARLALKQIADVLGKSFRLALRIASPYVIYALVVNLALALVNRLTPQVQVFFVATPFVAAGGLLLLYFTIKPAIEAFISGFGVWLISG